MIPGTASNGKPWSEKHKRREVRRQSAAATALWLRANPRPREQSGVALRLPPQSKIHGGDSQHVLHARDSSVRGAILAGGSSVVVHGVDF